VLAPRETGGNAAFKTVTVAWRSGAEAARAVTASMPLLAKADNVYVLGATETPNAEAQCREDLDAVARHLARHGIQAAPRLVAVHGNARDSVLNAAEELQSDLLVMGAYGHGRMRELVLGGFTQRILDGVGLPVFLFH
jgi:nucleotide-binding universal stress UspA family protein